MNESPRITTKQPTAPPTALISDDLDQRALHEAEPERLDQVVEQARHEWECSCSCPPHEPESTTSTSPGSPGTTSSDPAKVRRSTSGVNASSAGP